MPAWDTKRIVASRKEHLNWMHDHFADETLVAGEDSELDDGPGQPVERPRPVYPKMTCEAPAADPARVIWAKPYRAPIG